MRLPLTALAGLWLAAGPAPAGEVEILDVRFERRGAGTWSVSTTLRHADTGWEHYADAWRVEAPDGTELGTRILYHPHVNEQPFTRSLAALRLPPGMHTVVVRARDTVHGWSPDRVEVDLRKIRGERFEVLR